MRTECPTFTCKLKPNLTKLSDWGALRLRNRQESGKQNPLHHRHQRSRIGRTEELLRFRRNLRRQTTLLHERHNARVRNRPSSKRHNNYRAKRPQKRLRQHQRPSQRHRLRLRRLPPLHHQRNRRNSQSVKGKKVAENTELWVATSRTAKQLADKRGYTQVIEEAGGKFACDTCMAVAPLKGRFKALATTSAKGCFYSRQNLMKTKMGSMEECVDAAVTGKWNS